MQPAAPGHQHQNPVEREVQTLIKGVSCLLHDQQSLGPTWWDYAVDSWVATANCRPHRNEWLNLPISAHETIMGTAPEVARNFKFPFGCPVSKCNATTRSGVEICPFRRIRTCRGQFSPPQWCHIGLYSGERYQTLGAI
jgi:hypothetical protein